MRRRTFIGLGGSVLCWPFIARRAKGAQRVRQIGALFGLVESDPQLLAGTTVFKRALQELGWIEGQNIQINSRWGATDIDLIQTFAKELVEARPDVLFGHSTPVVAALQRETKTIPIVFVIVSDPVGSGFVTSFRRPGGNITGFVNLEATLGGKWIEILKEILPHVEHTAIMFNPDTAPYFPYYVQPFETAAQSLGVKPIAAPVHSTADVERIIIELSETPNSSLVLTPDVFTGTRSRLELIVSLAAQHRLPVIYPYRFMVTAGGLISYGIDQVDLFRRAPAYIDQILKGANPAELPVQLPTKFEMAVNLKTAKALGVNISATLLGRADEVIE